MLSSQTMPETFIDFYRRIVQKHPEVFQLQSFYGDPIVSLVALDKLLHQILNLYTPSNNWLAKIKRSCFTLHVRIISSCFLFSLITLLQSSLSPATPQDTYKDSLTLAEKYIAAFLRIIF